MATGFTEREIVQDQNAQTGANAPSQRLAVGGIQSAASAPQMDQSGLSEAMAAFDSVSDAIKRKKKNADFVEGQMASMAGKTQAEVAAEGNGTTMAGYVSLEVGNAVSQWQSAQTEAAAAEHYATNPEAYRKHLSKSAAGLIAQMGGDDYAEEQLTKAMAPAMQRLSAAQAAAHAQHTQTETVNAYTTALLQSGQYAAEQYDGSATSPNGPTIGATTGSSDYRAAAEAFTNQIIGAESGGNPNATNQDSTATGLGQFIGSTWLEMIKRHRPDIAAGKTTQELLDLRYNATLSRQMTTAYAAENLSALGASGLPTTKGTAYLSHFAGLSGARRVLRGDPNASVATTMTPSQINSNKKVMYKNGKLITNMELRNWADRKMRVKVRAGDTATAEPSAQVRDAIMTNPGLPANVHRQAVVGAVLTSLASGDGSLFQNAGGLDGLMTLNLNTSQIGQLRNAHKRFVAERQNEYNMEYERTKHNLMEDAASGEYTEEVMFEKLDDMYSTYGRSDKEMHRVHSAMQQVMDKTTASAALDVWDDPERQMDIVKLKNEVLDGTMSAEEAMAQIQELGELYGADEEATEQAVGTILGAYDKVRAGERSMLSKQVAAGQKVAATQARAAELIGRNILGTGSSDEQTAGIALLEKTLIEDLTAAGTRPEDLAGKASDMMAKVLVQNDVIDKKRASVVRAAFANPIGEDGKPTERSVEALAFYLDLKHGANASPEYLTRMFAGQEKTLEMLMTTEDHMIGDADMDTAIIRAYAQVTSPVTAARIADQQKRIDSGEMQEQVKQQIISDSGLVDTFWNNTMNIFNPNWASERIDTEARDRIMSDSGLDLIIEQEVRSATALMPNASSETISKIVSGQMSERGAIMGSSFVMAPTDKTMRDTMGLNSKEATAPNEAIIRYVMENGEAMFGPAVWEDLQPGIGSYYYAAGQYLTGSTLGDPSRAARAAGILRPEFVVELVGDNFVVRPTSAKYAFDDDIFFDDYASLPEAASAIIPAKEVGKFYNKYQTTPGIIGGVVNSAIDLFKSHDSALTGRKSN